VGYNIIPTYSVEQDGITWYDTIIGPNFKMPELWNSSFRGICKSSQLTYIQNNCTGEWLDINVFKNAVLGLNGPLASCNVPNITEYECYNNWLLGPEINWHGFDESINIKPEWAQTPIINIKTCPIGEMGCIKHHNGNYVVIGPNMTIESYTIDFSSEPDIITLSLEDTHIKNSVFENGHLHFTSLTRLRLSDTEFRNMTLTTSDCPNDRNFSSSFKCHGDGLYCVGEKVIVEGQIIPPSIDIENACIENMIIRETNSKIIRSHSLDRTELPDDISSIVLNDYISGTLKRCPRINPNGLICLNQMLINKNSDLRNIDVSGVDFSNMYFEPSNQWYNVYGVFKKCPMSVPNEWKCIEYTNKKTFIEEAMFLGKGIDYTNYDHIPDDIDATDVNMKDVKFHGLKRFYGFKGLLLHCPSVLPKGYTCHLYDKYATTCSSIPSTILTPVHKFIIVGPYTNLTNVNMNGICLDVVTSLMGVSGNTLACPTLSKKLKLRGYECNHLTNNFIIGPGVDLNGVPLGIFDNLASKLPNVKINNAMINGKLLVDSKESDDNCYTIENALHETCRDKYNFDCTNNLPNYICDTSNLHLGTCHGNCGDNLTSVYVENLSEKYRTIKTNSIPNHNYHIERMTKNKNQVCEHFLGIQMAIYPQRGSSFKETCLGPIGILKSGALIYNHMENLQETFEEHLHTLDVCQGHADDNCFYHIHNLTMELQCSHNNECEHIGFLRDGFPLYSRCSPLKSCYSNGKYEPSQNCHLDEANGYDFTGQNILDSNNNEISGYGYVVTSEFPHLPPKYAGSYVYNFITLNRIV
jgi:uncharacterized protein YjbI with pentapeptide repeats